MFKYQTDKFLDEIELGKLLRHIFGEKEVIYNRGLPSNKRIRPDYRVESLKLIFEYDGPRHYTQSKSYFSDSIKDDEYKNAGYRVIRFHFFVQPTVKVFNRLAGTNLADDEFNFTYPQGFIDSRVVLPADFCHVGIERFEEELSSFEEVANEIVESLMNKIVDSESGPWSVVPIGLHYLVPNELSGLDELDELAEPFYSQHAEECPHDRNLETEWFKVYKGLGGPDDKKLFEFKTKAFFAVTQDAYCGGNGPYDRGTSMDLFAKMYGPYEAYRIFLSIDSVTAYT